MIPTSAKSGQRAGAAATDETYERQAAAVFRRNRGGWGEHGDSDSGSQCAVELRPTAAIGDEFLKKRDSASTAIGDSLLKAIGSG